MTDGAAARGTSLHATAVIHGECGVLILGPSGSGKSALALALIARASLAGAFGALIGDDRVHVREAEGRIVASGAANMAGIVERRTAGLFAAQHEPAAILRLAVELSGRGRQWPRMPDDCDGITIGGVRLPRLALDSRPELLRSGAGGRRAIGCPGGGEPGRTRFSLEHCAAVHKNDRPEISPPA